MEVVIKIRKKKYGTLSRVTYEGIYNSLIKYVFEESLKNPSSDIAAYCNNVIEWCKTAKVGEIYYGDGWNLQVIKSNMI